MKLSSLFVQEHQPETDIKRDPAALEQGLQNGQRAMASKAPGQSVTGEILERKGSDILIAIGKNQLLRAKLDSSMQLAEGRQMTFSIKNLSGSKVVLSPLFTNMSNSSQAQRALQMASLPETEQSLAMVEAMMKEGMSIDKGALRQMMGALGRYPEARLETLVQLAKLQIPVSENALLQLEAYQNYQHRITESLLSIADSLTDTMAGLSAAGKGDEAISLAREILLLFTEGTTEETGKQTLLPGSLPGEAAGGTGMGDSLLGLTLENGTGSLPGEAAAGAGKLAYPPMGEAPEPESGTPVRTLLSGLLGESMAGFSEEELQGFARELHKAGLSEETVQAFLKGSITEKELLMQLRALLSGKAFPREQKESILRLLGSRELGRIFLNESKNQWLLLPEEVGREHKVSELYQKLESQLNRLMQALEQTSASHTPLAKAIANTAGNLDFMNQLNQMFQYVQLPLKLQGKEAAGELYVYTNKRSLSEKEGEVSALLHLDMEHIGSVNVHVSLKENQVATRFYLQDDSVLTFLAAHIELLNERLNKRGYSLNASFTKQEEEMGMMEELLQKDKPGALPSEYSFDVRA